jgi:3-oxo-5-alpha-steroid 4-dehydrogenase 1
MTDLYKIAIYLIFIFAGIVFVLLFFVSAPYGKFLRKGWGKVIKSKWAWMIMEFPSPLLMLFFYLTSAQKGVPQIIFLIFWLAHYLHRTFIYPFTQSGHDKAYPFVLVSMAFIFNCFNGFINGWNLSHGMYSFSWIMIPRFWIGVLLFITGFIINKTADEKLRKMRKNNPGEYVIPTGWLFNYISSPHYFGEIIEWAGFAVMTWSLPGLAFSVFTFANLFPRAIGSHKWYRANFSEYPKNRKALIPFLI